MNFSHYIPKKKYSLLNKTVCNTIIYLKNWNYENEMMQKMS